MQRVLQSVQEDGRNNGNRAGQMRRDFLSVDRQADGNSIANDGIDAREKMLEVEASSVHYGCDLLIAPAAHRWFAGPRIAFTVGCGSFRKLDDSS